MTIISSHGDIDIQKHVHPIIFNCVGLNITVASRWRAYHWSQISISYCWPEAQQLDASTWGCLLLPAKPRSIADHPEGRHRMGWKGVYLNKRDNSYNNVSLLWLSIRKFIFFFCFHMCWDIKQYHICCSTWINIIYAIINMFLNRLFNFLVFVILNFNSIITIIYLRKTLSTETQNQFYLPSL